MSALATVLGVGARTSVGLTAQHTAFLLRAGAAGFHEAPLLDSNDEPITIGSVPLLDPLAVGPARVQALAEAALDEAFATVGELAGGLRVRVVVGLDEALGRKGAAGEPSPAEALAWALRERLRKRVTAVDVDTLARGEAAAALKLADACALLARAEADVVLLGGAHSDYDPAIVRALSEAGRLFGGGHPNGVIPGESAAFVLLATRAFAARHALAEHAHLLSVGTGVEKARPDNDEPSFEALGLTLAIRGAGGALTALGERAGWLLTDMTAEVHRVNELQAAFVRSQRFFGEPQWIDAPAHKLGRLGAAALPLHVAIAATAWRHGFAPHRYALSLVGSDAGDRAATLWCASQSTRTQTS